MTDLIGGIDPGLAGGITLLCPKGTVVYKTIMPTMTIGKKNELDTKTIVEILRAHQVKAVGIEKQQAMPGQGAVSMFTIGKNYGKLIGIIDSLGITRIDLVSRAWQKVMFANYPKGDTKLTSIAVAQALFPKEDFRKSDRCTNKHDGLTDATLIAEYTRRQII